jgi:diphosphomevalonate decarboxylase
MMTKDKYVSDVLGDMHRQKAENESADAFMPSNIALVKYWGKRAGELNLPLVSSLSYTLDGYGTTTRIFLAEADSVEMNGKTLAATAGEFVKIMDFLGLFRAAGEHYRVITANNIPTAAGVASSASGFAALLAAIVRLKGWDLPLRAQSMLARLGSGSAARSFWPGLVSWHKGIREDGMDCYAEPYLHHMQPFCMAVLLIDQGAKAWSSREAMKISLSTSPLAKIWPVEQQRHLEDVQSALSLDDFAALGAVVENNAVLLHGLLEQSAPSIVFDGLETRLWKQRIKDWRAQGAPVYFTQDAGANLKLIFPLYFKEIAEKYLKNVGIDYFIV